MMMSLYLESYNSEKNITVCQTYINLNSQEPIRKTILMFNQKLKSIFFLYIEESSCANQISMPL